MTLIVDASPLVAVADRRDPRYAQLRDLLSAVEEQLVVPAPVTAEVDYLLASRFGSLARRPFLADLAAGRFVVPCLELADYATIVELESRYADLDPGLADLSLVIMAELRDPAHRDVRRAPLPRPAPAPGRLVRAASCGRLNESGSTGTVQPRQNRGARGQRAEIASLGDPTRR